MTTNVVSSMGCRRGAEFFDICFLIFDRIAGLIALPRERLQCSHANPSSRHSRPAKRWQVVALTGSRRRLLSWMMSSVTCDRAGRSVQIGETRTLLFCLRTPAEPVGSTATFPTMDCQIEIAINDASVILFVVDIREEMMPLIKRSHGARREQPGHSRDE